MTTLFVYGSLKKGCWNRDLYCGGAVSIEKAKMRGRLYELPSRIPVLEVSPECILAEGSYDVRADIRLQESLGAAASPPPLNGDWDNVRGELIVFDNPVIQLPPIDRLESFRPGQPCLYRRVLVPVATKAGRVVTAWAYTADLLSLRGLRRLRGGVWRPHPRWKDRG